MASKRSAARLGFPRRISIRPSRNRRSIRSSSPPGRACSRKASASRRRPAPREQPARLHVRNPGRNRLRCAAAANRIAAAHARARSLLLPAAEPAVHHGVVRIPRCRKYAAGFLRA